MCDVYAEALQNYLHSSEWRQTMEMFVGANCMEFHKVSEFSMSHYELWKNFQDIVENILEMALVDVGGSIETLEKFMDEVAYSDGYEDGPKHAVFKDIVKQLLSYESFESFRDMMVQAAHYKVSEGGAGATGGNTEEDEDADINYYIDTLTSMGYKASSIDAALGNVRDPRNCSLESLIEDIARIEGGASATSSGSPGKTRSGYSARLTDAAGEEQQQYSQKQQYGADEADTSDEPWINYRRYCAKVAEALAARRRVGEEGEGIGEWGGGNDDNEGKEADEGALHIPTDDHNEVDAKFVMAQSVLDNFNQGDTSPDLVAFLHWATSMLELLSEIESAYYADTNGDGEGFRLYTSGRAPDGIVLQYAHLDALRVKVESEGSHTSGMSDAELKRMAQLKAIADMGTSDEQLLHSLITRHEEVRNEITGLHKKCSLYVSSHNYAIKRENIEELYLFLKEKVRGGQEMTSEITDEMHEMIYNTTVGKSPELAMEVLGLLLELNVLEDEEIMVRARIQDIVGGSPAKRGNEGDNASGNGSSSSSSDDPVLFAGFESINPDLERDAKLSTSSGDSKPGGEDDTSGHAPSKGDGGAPDVAETKGSSSSSSSDGSKGAGRGACDEDKESHDAYLLAMKNKHLSSLSRLKDKLKLEKDRRLQDLEDRLMRRKLARKKLLASGGEVSKEDLDGDDVIEKQIADTCQQMAKIEEGMVGGLKKKCLFEMKVLKKKEVFAPLTAEDKREADRLASEELIKRYERDQKNLLTSLEAQRMKQKNKILARVKARKGEITPEVEKELRDIDIYFKEQVANALLEPQSNVLLGLSCINNLKEDEDGGEAKKTEDDDDDYFNDTDEKGAGGTREWLANVENVKDTYTQATRALQLQLIDAHYKSQPIDADGSAVESDGSFVDMSAHMLKVITDAYSKHSTEEGGDGPDYKYGHGNRKDDLGERIRAGIMDEFQRSKGAYNEILENNKATSKEKLLARRMAKRGSDAKETGSAGFEEEQKEEEAIVQMQAKMEKLVDNFLEDPVATVMPAPEPEVRVISDISPLKKPAGDFMKPKALPPIGTPSASPVKEGRFGTTPLKDIESSGEADAAKIRQKHIEKEKVLIDTLQTEMIQKKRQLEDRLKRKRDQRIKTENLAKESGVDNARVGISRQEEEIAAAEVERLQKSYDCIAQKIKSTGAQDIGMVDMEGVMKLLDQGLRGEEIGGLPMFAVQESSGKTGTDSYAEKASQEQAQKMMMQDEVKRISNNYSEEKQKFDLAMKVEQARQRSTLQRKLLAKKQAAGHKGAGYSADKAPDFTSFNMSGSGGGEGKVYAGGGQEAFRMPKSIPSAHNLHSAASRGMNLAPLMRK